MKWLPKWFGRKARDPLAELRRKPTDEERWSLLAEKLELDRLDALREGRATLHDLSNVAPGTHGHVIHTLMSEGLMVCIGHERAADSYTMCHYHITQKGMNYLQSADQNP